MTIKQTIKIAIIQFSLHFYGLALARVNILIHHAHIAFHLHLKMSSVSLIAAHSQRSLLMDGRFNFWLKVLHSSHTNRVVVEEAEL